MALFLDCGILSKGENCLKISIEKVNPDKLDWVRTCLSFVTKTGIVDLDDNDFFTVKNGGAKFVQQIAQISESLHLWAQRGAIIPQPRRIPADEGSAAAFFYQSICTVASAAPPASSSPPAASIIELARTANITIPEREGQQFKEMH